MKLIFPNLRENRFSSTWRERTVKTTYPSSWKKLTPQIYEECGLGKWHIPIPAGIDSPVAWGVWTQRLICSYPRMNWLPSCLESVDSELCMFLSTKNFWLPRCPGSVDSEKTIFLSTSKLTPQVPGECGLGKWHIPIRNWIDSPVTWRVWTRKLVCSYPRKKNDFYSPGVWEVWTRKETYS